ncbi:MAG: hypothetical protein HY327_12440, partial [Chloroflexi bacterium]|nr:hypothetical protein [Chloroflexota bacterium]
MTSSTGSKRGGEQGARVAARVCFSVLVILIPFRYRTLLAARLHEFVFREHTDFSFFASDLFLIATLAFWLIGLLLARRAIRFQPSAFSLLVFALVASAGMSISNSFDPPLSAYHFARLMLLAALYLFVVNEISVARIQVPLVLSIVLQSAIAILQVAAQHSLGLGALG